MNIKINKTTLDFIDGHSINALIYSNRDLKKIRPIIALFTHGYTSHKGDLTSWASQLSMSGITTVIFDLPGHYLGSYNEVNDLKTFQEKGPNIFINAYKGAISYLESTNCPLRPDDFTIILGGHSLGALMSILAMKLDFFADKNKINISVGIGMGDRSATDTLSKPFFKHFLQMRTQLVSESLSPSNIFPWIQKSKRDIFIENSRIHLITGLNDSLVSDQAVESFYTHLSQMNNQVTLERPQNLPHELPGNAIPFIKKFMRKEKMI